MKEKPGTSVTDKKDPRWTEKDPGRSEGGAPA